MQTRPEVAVCPVFERMAHGAAFGLALEVQPGVEIPGIAPDLGAAVAGGPDVPGPDPQRSTARSPTRVRLDPEGLRRRWSTAANTAKRVREQHGGEGVLLSVDFEPSSGYLMTAPGFARILIAPDGTELLCDPEPGIAEWNTLIPAQALPLAATLQGFEVLHASGVVLAGRAVLFTGPPGAGKSSLAAALLHLGAALLSDDTVALQTHEGALIAHPGAALLHLRDAERDRLSDSEREALGPGATFLGKQRYNPSVTVSPAPFGELFLLERSTEGPSVEWIEAIDPFALLASTFNLSVRTPDRLARHLDLASTLAATERVYRLRVQPGVDATRLAQTVHEHLTEVS